ncbi:PGPGW domain-containing protein [Marinobacteraceae bacterium S3BR75-40.1]
MPIDLFQSLSQWSQDHETLLWWLGLSSLLVFLASLVAIPWLVTRIPHDYFARPQRHPPFFGIEHPAIHWTLTVLSTLTGVAFILAGVLMLVLPGQGLLTIFIGLMLMKFPGKYRLVRWVIAWPAIYNAIARIRRKAGKGPLMVHAPDEGA